MFNGVNISDPHRSFTKAEWFKIKDKHEWIFSKHKKIQEFKKCKVTSVATKADNKGKDKEVQDEVSGNGGGFGLGAYKKGKAKDGK